VYYEHSVSGEIRLEMYQTCWEERRDPTTGKLVVVVVVVTVKVAGLLVVLLILVSNYAEGFGH